MNFAEDGTVFDVVDCAGVSADERLDFSANVNPFPMPEAVKEALARGMAELQRYPDSDARELRERAAEVFGVAPENLLAGNGSTEFIFAVPRRMRPRRVIVMAPCHHDYWRATEHAGGEAEGLLAAEADEFVPNMAQLELRVSGVDMVFFGNPNNPTGVAVPAESIRALAVRFPSTLFVVDEAYSEFVPDAGGASLLARPLPPNAVVLRSLSSFYGLPGLRLGFMVADREICAQIQRSREPWTVSGPAQVAGRALLTCERQVAAMREQVIGERERVRDELSRMTGLRVFHSQANFLLVKIVRPNLSSGRLCDRLLQQKILICNVAGLRGLNAKFVRISIRSDQENDRLLEAMKAALDEARWK